MVDADSQADTYYALDVGQSTGRVALLADVGSHAGE